MVLAAVLIAGLLWAMGRVTPARALSILGRASSTLASGNVITIGVAASLSGGGVAEPAGWAAANAVQLAVGQTNAAGGINIGGIRHTLALELLGFIGLHISLCLSFVGRRPLHPTALPSWKW